MGHADHPTPAQSPRTTPSLDTDRQPPTAGSSHEGHPQSTTKAEVVVRVGNQARPQTGCPPTDPRPDRDGPGPARRPRNWHRTLLAALLTAAIAAPLAGAARPQIPAPAPATVPPLTATTLAVTYETNRADAARAARMAAAHGDPHRATADLALASPSRHLLTFDGRGAGQATEVLGDLAHADHLAVLVPGSDTSLDTYARFHRAAAALYTDLTHRAPQHTHVAVIAWLGYETPATVSTALTTTARADEAAPRLRAFVRHLRAATPPRTHVSLLCHSYGSVVCGRAAPGLDADDMVLIGSPGTGADSAAALHTRARVWAARGSDDWVEHVPHVRAHLFGTTLGIGTDPVSGAFGARVFDAADADHSGYFTPGSASLANLARITLGETSEVTRA
ncbi:alpha/beta hydrolase [Streptomyces sp. NPDC049099]|uniref:alpha/beta hydrolase n=1 Tax=Streptomyces sp. NPDC049099 TaxID=3155768 RepID=UPI00341B4F14